MEISDISTNSMSKILFTTFMGMEAAGLKGPGAETSEVVVARSVMCVGVAAAAAARRSRPDAAAELG